MTVLFSWNPSDDPAIIHNVSGAAGWDAIIDFYTGGRPSPQLERVIEIARGHGVVRILIEPRYIDRDWRSEHSQFYSTTFTRYPSVCHRMHMFSTPLDDVDLYDLSRFASAYKGYSVMRPIRAAPVGRTMIAPPTELSEPTDAVVCNATETVDVLGWPMSVTAVPFVSQDGQFLRCAHAAMWMVFQHMHLRLGLPRRLPADIQHAALGGVIVNRQLPSDGLSIHQMLAAMNNLGLSPGQLPLPDTSTASEAAGLLSLFGIVCRYVNSNLPPIVTSNEHAWVIVGYTRERSAGHSRLTLYRHDDAMGPYIRVDDPWNEPLSAHRPWGSALLPLPPKIYMTAERAEAIAQWMFNLYIRQADSADPLANAYAEQKVSYLTYCVDNSRYKHGLVQRSNIDSELATQYRISNWPRNLWIVEAIDRRLRDEGGDCVLGEVIIDPTANQFPDAHDPGIIAVHTPGRYVAFTPDHRQLRTCETHSQAYESGRPR